MPLRVTFWLLFTFKNKGFDSIEYCDPGAESVVLTVNSTCGYWKCFLFSLRFMDPGSQHSLERTRSVTGPRTENETSEKFANSATLVNVQVPHDPWRCWAIPRNRMTKSTEIETLRRRYYILTFKTGKLVRGISFFRYATATPSQQDGAVPATYFARNVATNHSEQIGTTPAGRSNTIVTVQWHSMS